MSSTLSAAVPQPPAGRAARWAASVPAMVELLLVVAAILALWPFFDRVGQLGAGRDQRFLDGGIAVVRLPDAVLPAACDEVGARAEERLAAALCGSRQRGTPRALTALPPALDSAVAGATQAFQRPLRDAEAHVLALRVQAENGGTELRADSNAIAAIESDIAPFRQRFQIADSDDGGPLPLRCAVRWIDGALAARLPADGGAAASAATARANAVLLLAAALDGRAATAALAADALLPPAATRASGCRGGAESLGATAAVLADARQSLTNARMNEAMRALVASAGVQWAAAMALGYAFLAWSRRAASPPLGSAAALAAWAGAAWLARVPWPLAGARDFTPARAEAAWTSAPAAFVLALAGIAIALLLVALARRSRTEARAAPAAQAMSSRIGYPGLVVATGLGGLILLDLSLDGHAGNRYLALYHQGHLWLAMLVLSLLLFARRALARAFAWLLSVGGEAIGRASRRFGAASVAVLLVLAAAVAVLAFAVALAHLRQLTSELGRVWLIVGAMFATRDMGPLLIAGYASGAFLAAALAMWWHHRSGQALGAFALALCLFAAWIGAVTFALFRVGAYDSVTASRLESVAAPFASINDQLALVSWFQRAAPVDGFGIGAAPWCGFASSRACSGVPAQIHSDYTFTAMVGVFGPLVAWGVSVAMALWLHRLIRHHGRVTRGEPRLVGSGGQLGHDGQALVSWIAVAWVVLTSCQLAVTVAGNLAVLPLTGVTFPFVSFGMTSLLVNTAFLALCLNVDLPARSGDG